MIFCHSSDMWIISETVILSGQGADSLQSFNEDIISSTVNSVFKEVLAFASPE